jgi:hypothetical protein
MAGGALREVVRVDVARGVGAPDRPRKVVVTVDEGYRPQYPSGALEMGLTRLCREDGRGQEEGGCSEERSHGRHAS